MNNSCGDSEHPKPEFCGTMTVGERGQVVIPAKTRKELTIEKGDTLFSFKVGDVLITAKLETLERIAEHATGKAAIIRELLNTIK
ncbi:MAG: AbrB/MazE/SpoVT family DNA-binding domain-containing protein [Patescibacteria group bacterium UBA2163]